jgi:hypothetical protein
VKDVTSTSFGLIIAYLLPGFCAFFALSFWWPQVADIFSKFLEAESNIGLFLFVIVCSLIAGLEISIFRWILFERWLCRKSQLDRTKFAHLGVDAKLTAFRAAVDEHYRYHQFWGGMAVAIPFIGLGLIKDVSAVCEQMGLGCGFLLVEIVTIFAGCSAFQNYVDRATHILEGLDHGQRMGENREGGPQSPSTNAAPATPSATTSTPAATTSTPATTPAEKVSASDAGEKSCGVTDATTPEAAVETSKSKKD